ncbi:MAG: hypothetical protein IT258_21125 [Saprospiraceae bacterium]|nr:hypothetical protein [Saprospiraceae bacterium]
MQKLFLLILQAITILYASAQTMDNCPNATRYSVSLCIDESQAVHWFGIWDECFNLGTQTAWAPELGLIQIRSQWELCSKGFYWNSVQYQCPVPNYTWTVEQEMNYWVGNITFSPNECLAEAVPNCYAFTIYGSGCQY